MTLLRVLREAGRMYRVVLIDDDRWALKDIRKTFDFERFGFLVEGEYASAEAAFDAVLASPPDLIISDIRMEKASGLDMVKWLRDRQIRSLVIIVSGYDRFDYAQEALRQGVFDYLLKPLDDAQVHRLMERIVQKLEQEKAPSYSNDAFGQAVQYVDEHYNISLPLEKVAEQFYMNKNYLSELFSKRMNMTFTQYKSKVRVGHAKQLLSHSAMSITEIAYAVGFNSSSRFSKVFCQVTGMSPQCYRQMQEKDNKG